MSKRLRISGIISIISMAILTLVFVTFGASAISESEMSANITRKVQYANLYNCYKNYIDDKNPITTSLFSNANRLFPDGIGDQIVTPEGWPGISGGRCGDLVNSIIGPIPNSESERGVILQKLGYTKVGGSDGSRKCLWYKFSRFTKKPSSGYDESSVETQHICANVNNGVVTNPEVTSGTGDGFSPIVVGAFEERQLCLNNVANPESTESRCIPYSDWESLKSGFKKQIDAWDGNLGDKTNGEVYYTPSDCDDKAPCEDETPGDTIGEYKIENRETAASIAASNFLGLQNGNFTTAEKVSLYQFYLKNSSSSIVCNPTDKPNEMLTHPVKLVIKSEYYNNCYTIENATGGKVHAVDGEFSLGKTIGYQDIIDELNSMTASTDREGIIDPGAIIGVESGTPIGSDSTDDTDGDGVSDSDNVCYGSPGTLGLSWILCPIMQMLHDTLNSMYKTAEENFLKLDAPNLLGEDTKNAWQIFQGAANIVFVIFLLVVIFSQLTGIGIDNYGIKKILPRLIVCAILVNLSFFIAQLLVDGSNIVGVSVRNLFEDIAKTGNEASGGALAGEAFGAALLTGGAAVALRAFYVNPALLLSLLLTLLTSVIAVISLLAILVAREVGVVVAVVLAPLAFACYVFPNTSKWLKSWGNLMKGLLLLYPLASGLVGASAFVSGVVAKAGGDSEWMALAAMLVRVIPFFFLPTLFRKSMDAVGNIGTRIQGLGRGLSGGLTRRISSTEGYKNLQKTSLERQNRFRAGLDKDGNLTDRGLRRARRANSELGRLFGMDGLQAKRIARAHKAREEGISDTSELGEAITRSELSSGGATNRKDNLTNQLLAAARNGSSSEFFAALDQAQKSGMKSSDIAKITRSVFDTASWGGTLSDNGNRGNFFQEFANRYGGTFLKKDAEQKSWAATRAGLDSDIGAVHSLENFARDNGMKVADLKDNEVIDLSADRLSELLNNGIIDRAQAQRIWASGANMDSVNKLMLGAFARGDINGGNALSKTDAEQMVSKSYTGGLHGLSVDQVKALTESTPQDTVIRDVRWRNEKGEHEQTDPLIVRNENRPPQNPPTIWTPNNPGQPPAQGGSSS